MHLLLESDTNKTMRVKLGRNKNNFKFIKLNIYTLRQKYLIKRFFLTDKWHII